MNYTKGEWKVVTYPDFTTIRTIQDTIAILHNSKGDLANAHLISAAPDMYEALKATWARMESLYETILQLTNSQPDDEDVHLTSEARELAFRSLAKAEVKEV